MIRRLHLAAAITAGLVAASLVIATFLVPGTRVPGVAVFVVFGLMFPIFGGAVIPLARRLPSGQTQGWRERNRQTRLMWRGLRQSLPAGLGTLLAAIFILAWIVMASSILRLPGQPERQKDHYFANDHGRHIPLTKVEYDRDLGLQYRLFAATATAFYAATIGLVLVKPAATAAGGN